MFDNKKIFILGMARSGYEAAKYLSTRRNKVILNDGKEESFHNQEQVEELKKLGVEFVFGSHPDDLLDSSFDYLIKNPGVPIDHKYVVKAQELGIEVINEVEMSYRLLPEDVTLVGITGTNGKTTTTTLTYEILHEAMHERVHLAGNIGYPLCSFLEKLKKDDIIVMEVSCQQGENIKEFKPNIGLFTNISEAHIDFLKTFDHYKEVKSRMFYNQTKDDIAILNIENDQVMNQLKNIQSKTKYFSSKNEINGCYLKEDAIYYYEDKVIDIKDIKIPGIHNLENCMAAIMIAKEFDVDNKIIDKVLSEFKGVEHRLEYVDTVNDVRYYNDTEATNIKCTQIALASFIEPTTIILGGLERGQVFDDLAPYMKNVKNIIGIGECRHRVKAFGENLNIPTYVYEKLSDGFKKCVEVTSPGGIILLSPASASWDQYKECEIRGAEFKKHVSDLKKGSADE
ncbi:MAG: UDP-N-acetylmuramoyl-L-alanine--D-glutamate ligase [Bacilli bacterium]|nr:UDP-N-acetylmuramoyl-L-alanine--D-glutamate ligase [Bacilli bacterium]